MVWLPSPEGEVYFYDFKRKVNIFCYENRNRRSQLFHDLAVALDLEHICLGECPVMIDDPILA